MPKLVASINDPELSRLIKESKENRDFVEEGVYIRVTPHRIYAVINTTILIFERSPVKDLFSEIREIVKIVKERCQ